MVPHLPHRFRRLRKSESLRKIVRETHITINDFILPLFVEEEIGGVVPIDSMPGVVRYPENQLADAVKEAWDLGIQSILLFGISHHKDADGADTWNEEGLMARSIRVAKAAVPEMVVISDNCFCEYTVHGHCGILQKNDVVNDLTLVNLQQQAVVAAKSGVDLVAPSAMMDGQIIAMRNALDEAGFSEVAIMSYSTKFASSFYGPFRDAVDVKIEGGGNRKTYQMDYANGSEAVAESLRDEDEYADMLMIKPGLAYLDILSKVSESTHLPVAVYQVSGEYGMIKASVNAGIIDEQEVVMETMTAFKRAGARLIISYYAKDMAQWLK